MQLNLGKSRAQAIFGSRKTIMVLR